MSEDEIIGTFEHWIEYEKANKDKINKADDLIEIQQGLLDLYKQEKEKNEGLDSEIIRTRATLNEVTKDYVSKDKIRDKLEYATKMKEVYITNESDHILIPIYNEVIKVCEELLED